MNITNLRPEQLIEDNNSIKYNTDGLHELGKNMMQFGILNPLIVYPVHVDLYMIIDGRRRFRALRLKGINNIPCLIIDINSNHLMELRIILDSQSRPTLPIQYREALIKYLASEGDLVYSVLKDRLSATEHWMCTTLKTHLLSLAAQRLLFNDKIKVGNALILTEIPIKSQGDHLNMAQNCEMNYFRALIEGRLLEPDVIGAPD